MSADAELGRVIAEMLPQIVGLTDVDRNPAADRCSLGEYVVTGHCFQSWRHLENPVDILDARLARPIVFSFACHIPIIGMDQSQEHAALRRDWRLSIHFEPMWSSPTSASRPIPHMVGIMDCPNSTVVT